MKKTKNIFLNVALVVLAGYLVYNIISVRIDIANASAEQRETIAKIEAVKQLNAEYKSILESCGSDSYFERIAREKLDYVYPNERVYIDRSGK